LIPGICTLKGLGSFSQGGYEIDPRESLIDYKLLWGDPLPKWISDHERVVLTGDAAHPHLLTSGTRGAQVIEDGATIAALLEKLGKDQIPLAFQAFEKLRQMK